MRNSLDVLNVPVLDAEPEPPMTAAAYLLQIGFRKGVLGDAKEWKCRAAQAAARARGPMTLQTIQWGSVRSGKRVGLSG